MSLPGTRLARKLDAIDTDQITPAADCVSESLETLDERWKAGSFRYLMPDFRARVHRGETFVIAGDRFAIGSSREMSPAGLKGVAEEVGLEMVVVCGENMGDIFRRNAFNLGLHVVQSPEAVADARDGDEFSFDPGTRAAAQRHAGQDLHAGAAVAEGRGDPPERRHLRRRPPRVRRLGRRSARRSTGPTPELAERHDDHRADRLGAPRRQGSAAERAPARARRCASTPTCCRPRTAPRRSRSTPSTRSPAARTIYPRQAAIANDHFVFTGVDADDKQTAIGREFARAARHRAAVLRDARRRHLPLLLSRAGAGPARPVHPRRRLAQPRLRRVRRGRHRRGIDDARIRLVDRLHLLHARARSAASSFAAGCSRGSAARTSCSSCCGAGARSSRRACRWSSSTPSAQLPIAYRNTIANMMAEAEALNGIFAPDDITVRVVPRRRA